MTRTDEQAKNLRDLLERFDDAEEASDLVAQAAYEASAGFGLPAESATFEAMVVGCSWLGWWVDELRARDKLTAHEAAKMHGVIRMATSVWATNARDFALFAEGVTA